MSVPRQSSPDAYLNLMLTLLAGTGGLLALSGPLTSSRPNPSSDWAPTAHGFEGIPARLWQDPIETAIEHLLESKKRQADDEGHFLATTDFEAWVKGLSPERPHVLVLPVMTRGRNYPEDREFRLRSRYAVVTGLLSAGYRVEDANHIGALRLEEWPCMDPNAEQEDSPRERELGVDCHPEVEGTMDTVSCTELVVTVGQDAVGPGLHDVTVTNPDPAGCTSEDAVTLSGVPPP